MRLITHNLLACNVKNCTNGYPLKIDSESTIVKEDGEVDREFIEKMLTRLDYNVLYKAAKSIGIDIPATYDASSELSDEFINTVGNAILNVSINDGKLECPSCCHVFTIKNGIPNMVLKDE